MARLPSLFFLRLTHRDDTAHRIWAGTPQDRLTTNKYTVKGRTFLKTEQFRSSTFIVPCVSAIKITRRDTVHTPSLLKTKFWDRKLASISKKNKKLDFLGGIW